MDRETVAKELAEEIRVNTKLRHRLGMSEGAGSGVIEGEPSAIGITNDEDETFFISVQEG